MIDEAQGEQVLARAGGRVQGDVAAHALPLDGALRPELLAQPRRRPLGLDGPGDALDLGLVGERADPDQRVPGVVLIAPPRPLLGVRVAEDPVQGDPAALQVRRALVDVGRGQRLQVAAVGRVVLPSRVSAREEAVVAALACGPDRLRVHPLPPDGDVVAARADQVRRGRVVLGPEPAADGHRVAARHRPRPEELDQLAVEVDDPERQPIVGVRAAVAHLRRIGDRRALQVEAFEHAARPVVLADPRARAGAHELGAVGERERAALQDQQVADLDVGAGGEVGDGHGSISGQTCASTARSQARSVQVNPELRL